MMAMSKDDIYKELESLIQSNYENLKVDFSVEESGVHNSIVKLHQFDQFSREKEKEYLVDNNICLFNLTSLPDQFSLKDLMGVLYCSHPDRKKLYVVGVFGIARIGDST